MTMANDISNRATVLEVHSILKNTILKHLGGDREFLCLSILGSRMWRMHRPDSDFDIVVIYMDSMKAYTSTTVKSTLSSQRIEPYTYATSTYSASEFDISYMEINHFAKQLTKGNCNAIWTLTTPLMFIPDDSNEESVISKLRTIFLRNGFVYDMWPSIKGITFSNIIDMNKRIDVRSFKKSFLTGARNLAYYREAAMTGSVYEPYNTINESKIMRGARYLVSTLDDAISNEVNIKKCKEYLDSCIQEIESSIVNNSQFSYHCNDFGPVNERLIIPCIHTEIVRRLAKSEGIS